MADAKATLLVTGANGGLGSAIVSKVTSSPSLSAYYGIYTVRDASAMTPALDTALKQTSPSSSSAHSHPHSYDEISLDLSKLSNVREVARVINARVAAGEIPPIRAIVLNAGYQEFQTQTWTEDGLDMTFTVNYLSHWLLTLLLLQSMDREMGRVIWISSFSHNPRDSRNKTKAAYTEDKYTTTVLEHVDEIAEGTWSANKNETTTWVAGWRRYAASKLFGVTMMHELQRRLDQDPVLKNISILSLDPGAMGTNLSHRSDSWFIRVFVMQILIPAMAALLSYLNPNGPFRTLAKSAGDVLAAAFDCGPPPLSERPKELYLNGSELGEYNDEAKEPRNWNALWRSSVKYAHLTKGETALERWE